MRIRIRDLALARVRYGYRRIQVLLERERWTVNHKRVYRLYKQEGLELRLKTRKKKRVVQPRSLNPDATLPNDRWSSDFMSDKFADGRSFRVLTLVENVSRVSPGLKADFRMSAERVCQVLDRAIPVHGQPKSIGLDNGPEFISNTMDAWAYRMGIKLCYSRPGKPTDNAFCESFNGKLRDDFLRTNWFESMSDLRIHVENWREENNRFRPHSSVGDKSPNQWLESQSKITESGKH